MPKCPICGTNGAYVGFNTIECRNYDCIHFKLETKAVTCYCCGQEGHDPSDCPEQMKSDADKQADGPPSMYSGNGNSSPSCGNCNNCPDCTSSQNDSKDEAPDWDGDCPP